MDEKISESTDNGRVDSILMLDDVILRGWPLFSQINKGSNAMVKKTFSLSFCTYKPDLNSFTTPKKKHLLILHVISFKFFWFKLLAIIVIPYRFVNVIFS